MIVWHLEPNDQARHFYAALGFHTEGTTRVFLERPDAVVHEVLYRIGTATARGEPESRAHA